MKNYEDVVKFHGHSCPGLALGFRVATKAMEELGIQEPSMDEEIVAIVENDSCAVDAIQVVTGCTFGKGNLILKDHGKQAYTFIKRTPPKALRIYIEFGATNETNEEKIIWEKYLQGDRSPLLIQKVTQIREQKIEDILNAPWENILKITYPKIDAPSKARIFKSVKCELCGENISEPKARLSNGKIICIPCSGY